MKIQEILKVLEQFAPPLYQEEYDNSGLLLGNRVAEITSALITLDITGDVIEEAVENNCGLIISHHPLIFKALKSITGNNYIERILIKAIKNDISIYAIHTNLDNTIDGVNNKLGELLDLTDLSVLNPLPGVLRKLVTFSPVDHAEKVRKALFSSGAGEIGNYDECSFNMNGQGTFRGGENTDPFVGNKGETHFENEVRIETIFPVHKTREIIKALLDAHPYEEVAYDIYPLEMEFDKIGSGMIGYVKKRIKAGDYLETIKENLNIPELPYSGDKNMEISKVAFCGGSGSFLIRDAMRKNADMFLTGDIKYHDYFQAEENFVLADIGHYHSEKHIKELIYSVLKQKFSNFALLISKINTNPVSYI